MNVLHINQSDSGGGAAIAGYRLHQELLAQNIDSKLLVEVANLKDQRVALIPHRKIQANLISQISSRLGLHYVHFTGTFDIPKHEFYQDADILNFHNLHSNKFSYLAIPALTKHKPAIFTLHDMWGFTGHCAYSYDCDRWKSGCGKCPYPNSYPEINRDTTRWVWNLKDWVYRRSSLTIVTPSQWLTEQARQSILNRFPICHIPNGVDTTAYQPLDPDLCRSALNIPLGKKVLLFGAEQLHDSRKGGDLLLKALSQLPPSLKAEIVILTLGNSSEVLMKELDMQVCNLGYVSSDRLKSIAYSAADLFIFPTRADNLPLVLQESIACGTPMVSFKIGGVPDLVRPSVTGYLATPEDPQDFQNGILQLLEDAAERERLGQNCRAIALQEYTLELQVKRYIKLYQQILNKQDV